MTARLWPPRCPRCIRPRPGGRGRTPDRRDRDEHCKADATRNHRFGTAEQRDERLRERQGDDEQTAPRREHREVDVPECELGAEQGLPNRGPEGCRRDHPDDRDPDDDEDELSNPGAEVVVLPRVREVGHLLLGASAVQILMAR